MRKRSGFIFVLGFGFYGWLEFEALILVGNMFGGFLSFIGIFVTAFVGLFLIRRLNSRVFKAWHSNQQENNTGLTKLAEGLSILLGGLLLVIPGYLTDLVGLILMIPIIRTVVGSIIIANFADASLFTNLRKKHEHNYSNENHSKNQSPIIIIDGDYKEK